MINILFWNTGLSKYKLNETKREINVNNALVNIVELYKSDIIILAEYSLDT